MLKPTPPIDRSGDQEPQITTVRSLFESEETGLLRYAFSIVGRRAVAEEIVQEVFLQLHQRWDQIDAPQAWLFRSVRNRVYNHLRNHRREVFSHGQTDEPSDAEGEDLPEALLERMEAMAKLREMLGELDEVDRQLVTLKYFEGLKYKEISERTGLSVGNVGYRLHHILKELAHRLRSLGIDEDS
ncbi:RNA polymerase sigma factor [Rhodopirellula sp. MGV]|uniref:RNA polymerase sigma factor n=1 Tax=Rhodopirellula sp. MGV TaxID=2023130 RepID=UPI000B96CB9D|nr:sigma-70 family RNA polymerase sigma factor [Rhodopirellula sp. MGV]OYP33886.1 RNA polymerase subunit sigma-24 [Rhodopirellula sp. MGV]PNY37307.1 RNA polymerase subunit sigma-24 [Rhodopirellula baltica]